MAAAAMMPKSAAGDGAGKTIEETYRKKTHLEHILLRPDAYIGSVEKHIQYLWVYEDGAMVFRDVRFVPGLYKIFEDPRQYRQQAAARPLHGLPPGGHRHRGRLHLRLQQRRRRARGDRIYMPEMMFGHLLASGSGRDGYGAKFANIFSTEFVVETADGRRQKKYKQVLTYVIIADPVRNGMSDYNEESLLVREQ
jgi:DNA topoisomerase-2